MAKDWTGAACTEVDPELFFPVSSTSAEAEYAKSICSRCDVKDECLNWAIDTDQRFGIWGGEDVEQRMRQKRDKAGRFLVMSP